MIIVGKPKGERQVLKPRRRRIILKCILKLGCEDEDWN
jgi:hypothetical protein